MWFGPIFVGAKYLSRVDTSPATTFEVPYQWMCVTLWPAENPTAQAYTASVSNNCTSKSDDQVTYCPYYLALLRDP